MLITLFPSIFSLCFQDCILLIFVTLPTIGPNNFYFRTLNNFFCLVCSAVVTFQFEIEITYWDYLSYTQ